MTFSELNIIKPLLAALEKVGYEQPTPIQQQSIPHILKGTDLFGCAQTGTGKTAAFSLPMLQALYTKRSNDKKVRALILAPTRELVTQISDNIRTYSTNLNISHTTIFGGVSQMHQVNALKRGVEIIVATPGRLLDLMHQGYVDLRNLEFFVLDEADRMLDMGFINDIKKIIARIPAKRQTLFFSATLSPEVKSLAQTLLTNPAFISTSPVSSASENVDQSLFYVSSGDKKALLKYIIQKEKIENVLVFTRTKREADKVAKDLNGSSISAEAIHGNKSQNARERALAGFKSKKIRVLVATDIASRGIDVQRLSHVINYQLPDEPETYVHRIGRTGRAGEHGTAFSFCDPNESLQLKGINKLLNKNISVVETHPYVCAQLEYLKANIPVKKSRPKRKLFNSRRPASK